ncbi:2-C-methyl-D-erythritol 2,4-cyclodiphosphate synthase [Spirochaeta isovalerica]|uniref:2-C-methyl-D-erythritol 2,4-cyclodiphosphate synthase n=1 Tax=Spirochaeta isovalerica TaxID=150 RepID=A0A841RB35_9SPIO|nr:2-C-methyl-D-erythritol 2,4-cyclodiphosphate synthase [Spirochaeta isovalerica]MBB6482604.1 2-C-methyl-D-erythritol 2,4-cyclodiphosphate synthase [Spirochaeta isovalerica]
MRIGFGYDLHKLKTGRKLMIGGVHIPCDFGEEAHSDGDVLLHAVIDALFGAIAEGDIGSHFPPSDIRWKDVSSLVLLKKTMEIIRERKFSLINLDCTVVLEKPKLLPYKEEIRQTMADALGTDISRISVKGKTKEKVDAVGRGEAIEAYASLLLASD